MVQLILEDGDGDFPPYIYYDGAQIVLAIEGKLYAEATYGGSTSSDIYNGIDKAWEISNTLKADYINDLLKEIKPLADQLYDLMEVENGKGVYLDDDAYDLYDEIADIVKDYNWNKDETTSADLFNTGEYIEYIGENYVVPEEVEDYVDSGNSLYDGIVFSDTPEEAKEYAYAKIIEDIQDSRDIAKDLSEVKKVYEEYGHQKTFVDKLIPRLLDEIEELDFDGKDFYFDGEKLELN